MRAHSVATVLVALALVKGCASMHLMTAGYKTYSLLALLAQPARQGIAYLLAARHPCRLLQQLRAFNFRSSTRRNQLQGHADAPLGVQFLTRVLRVAFCATLAVPMLARAAPGVPLGSGSVASCRTRTSLALVLLPQTLVPCNLP